MVTLRWACRRCGRGREFLEVEQVPELGPDVWHYRCAYCGRCADLRDPLGGEFTLIVPEERCPN